MSGITIGDLRHRVRLEAATRSSDDGGGATEIWNLEAEIWAAIRPSRGGETALAHGVAGHVSHEVWIRHRADVGPHHRFTYGARTLGIRAALDVDGRRQWLRCLCEEQVP